jgi:signal transduction histidine kinase
VLDRYARRNQGRRAFLPLLVALVQVIGTLWASHWNSSLRELDWGGVALLLAAPLTLLWRRYPLIGVAVTLAATIGYFRLGYPSGPVMFGAVVTTLVAARRATRYLVWAVVAAAYTVALIVIEPTLGQAAALAVVGAAVLTAGEGLRARDQQLGEVLRTRAEQAKARAEQERRQVSDQRLRIARELHDVIGHHLSLINVQAGVGLHLMEENPDQARQALAAIKQASSEALREVRGVLGALRPDDENAPRAPVPLLADLPMLLDEARSGGLPVQLTTIGDPVPLPAEVDRAGYRIVQEGLTNVRRHAGPGASARVVVEYADDSLALTVTDDGAGPAAGAQDGNGIVGMRERVTALGGGLVTGAGPAGGYRVAARLPLNSAKEQT